jgi:hypothetical protein
MRRQFGIRLKLTARGPAVSPGRFPPTPRKLEHRLAKKIVEKELR